MWFLLSVRFQNTTGDTQIFNSVSFKALKGYKEYTANIFTIYVGNITPIPLTYYKDFPQIICICLDCRLCIRMSKDVFLMVKLYGEGWVERDMLTNFDTTVVESEKAGTLSQPFPHLVALIIAATWVSVRELMSCSTAEMLRWVIVGRVVKSWIFSSWYSNFILP